MRVGVQESMHGPCKLRICREREGRGLFYVGSGGPSLMGLPLAQAPVEKPPRCHLFICARLSFLLDSSFFNVALVVMPPHN